MADDPAEQDLAALREKAIKATDYRDLQATAATIRQITTGYVHGGSRGDPGWFPVNTVATVMLDDLKGAVAKHLGEPAATTPLSAEEQQIGEQLRERYDDLVDINVSDALVQDLAADVSRATGKEIPSETDQLQLMVLIETALDEHYGEPELASGWEDVDMGPAATPRAPQKARAPTAFAEAMRAHLPTVAREPTPELVKALRKKVDALQPTGERVKILRVGHDLRGITDNDSVPLQGKNTELIAAYYAAIKNWAETVTPEPSEAGSASSGEDPFHSFEQASLDSFFYETPARSATRSPSSPDVLRVVSTDRIAEFRARMRSAETQKEVEEIGRQVLGITRTLPNPRGEFDVEDRHISALENDINAALRAWEEEEDTRHASRLAAEADTPAAAKRQPADRPSSAEISSVSRSSGSQSTVFGDVSQDFDTSAEFNTNLRVSEGASAKRLAEILADNPISADDPLGTKVAKGLRLANQLDDFQADEKIRWDQAAAGGASDEIVEVLYTNYMRAFDKHAEVSDGVVQLQNEEDAQFESGTPPGRRSPSDSPGSDGAYPPIVTDLVKEVVTRDGRGVDAKRSPQETLAIGRTLVAELTELKREIGNRLDAFENAGGDSASAEWEQLYTDYDGARRALSAFYNEVSQVEKKIEADEAREAAEEIVTPEVKMSVKTGSVNQPLVTQKLDTPEEVAEAVAKVTDNLIDAPLVENLVQRGLLKAKDLANPVYVKAMEKRLREKAGARAQAGRDPRYTKARAPKRQPVRLVVTDVPGMYRYKRPRFAQPMFGYAAASMPQPIRRTTEVV